MQVDSKCASYVDFVIGGSRRFALTYIIMQITINIAKFIHLMLSTFVIEHTSSNEAKQCAVRWDIKHALLVK